MKKTLLLFLFLPLTFFGQISLTNGSPHDLQLVARVPGDNNLGIVPIGGTYDKSGAQPNYTSIRVKVYRGSASSTYDSGTEVISYSSNFGTFDFGNSIKIKSETDEDYRIEIYGVTGNTESNDPLHTAVNVVAGDVYIIEGQSNAEARLSSGSSNGNKDPFIRVYANGTPDDSALLGNDNWYEGQGDGGRGSNGNAGQWGLKLANLLLQEGYPIAIFNGARGAKGINYFQKKASPDSGEPTNNYERLLYRLNKTGLKDHVKALFWSQGENVSDINSVEDYKEAFLSLKGDWETDYSSIEQFYIFQTRNGCTSWGTLENLYIKEAQRQLAVADVNIHIMSTDGLIQFDEGGTNGFCHFVYSNGYDDFANRIYNLVDRDFYNGSAGEIDPPNITEAYLTDATTLVVETDASKLFINNSATNNFQLDNANGATIVDTDVSDNKIIFSLSEFPGNNPFISNLGEIPGVYNNLITSNVSDLELLSFYKYPIDVPSLPQENRIMITQYYEGNGSNDRWIEIKNISGTQIAADKYYLVLFEDNQISGISNKTPAQSIAIQSMAIDEVLLFKKSTSSIPNASNLGSAIQISTSVCSFTGDDIILISYSNDNYSYINRQDMVGTNPKSTWGLNKTFIRGDDAMPNKDFDINDWMEFSLEDINNADPYTNWALGTQVIGPTSWPSSGSGWSNLDPDGSRSVTVTNNNYDANDGTFTVKNLVINNNKTLNFDKGTTNSVVVYGNLTNNGTFIIGDQESLVMYGSGSISGSIKKYEKSVSRNNFHDVTYWSSPMQYQSISSAFPGVTPSRIFYYDQSQTDIAGSYLPWLVALSGMIMEPGMGFAAEGLTSTIGPHNIDFVGTPNTGQIIMPLKGNFGDGNLDNDFNLIGNPYPSAVNLNAFFDDNPNIDPIVYLWTHNTAISNGDSGDFTSDDYASYNYGGGVEACEGCVKPDSTLASSQGFFVRAMSSGTVKFENDMRLVGGNDLFFKSSISKKSIAVKAENEKDRIWLNLTTDQGGFSQILLGFKRGLTNKVDPGYDALRFEGSSNPISFYSVIQKEKYVIQGQRTFVEQRKARLGFDTTVAPRMFTISIDKTEGALKGIDVFLVDRHLKKTHNLSKSDYSFLQLTTGKFKNRFILRYTESVNNENAIDAVNTVNRFEVFDDSQGLVVKSNNVINKFSVFNIYGKRYRTIRPKKNSFKVNGLNWIKSGSVIIVEVTFLDGEVKTKKIIKN